MRRERSTLPQEHGALHRRLPEVETGVERELLRFEAGGLGLRGVLEQERGDVAEHILVVRLGIGDTRLQPDVGCHHRGVVLPRHCEIVGITGTR